MKGFLTLDLHNAIINAEYEKQDGNVYIRINNVENNLVYVYCSSNDLYRKDDRQDFESKIVHGNRYEWTNRSAETIPAKEIFIRDIWLSWYSRGIQNPHGVRPHGKI